MATEEIVQMSLHDVDKAMCAHNMKLTYKGTSTLADKKRHLTEYNTCPEKNQHTSAISTGAEILARVTDT